MSEYQKAPDDFEPTTDIDSIIGEGGAVIVDVPGYGMASSELLSGGQVEDLRSEYGGDFIFDRTAVLDILQDTYERPDFNDVSVKQAKNMKPASLQLFLVPLAPGLFENGVRMDTYETPDEDFEPEMQLEDLAAPDYQVEVRAEGHGKVVCRLVKNSTLEQFVKGDNPFNIERGTTVKLLKHHYPEEYGFNELTEMKAKQAPASAFDPFVFAMLPDLEIFLDYMGNSIRET